MYCGCRERELSKVERGVVQQSEQLQALRDEATKLYSTLMHRFPELQTRLLTVLCLHAMSPQSRRMQLVKRTCAVEGCC